MSKIRQGLKVNDRELIIAKETSSIPVDDLEQLHQFRPDLVDVVLQSYTDKIKENNKKLDYFFYSFVLCLLSIVAIIGLSVYLAFNGKEDIAKILLISTCAIIGGMMIVRHIK